ncbi:MAG: hypothetical protein DRN25_05965 [Thermoplasmata archaeon]|nr:MAG: hypothetical protein DRN25_05965 [Thermoplasmata archaeon]
MPIVTLVGERMAKKGNEFIYLGPNPDCKNCKLKTVCFNLKRFRRYKIVGIRNKRHSCNQHDGGVRVVEVEELPLLAGVEGKVREGSKIKIKVLDCKRLDCENFEICHNPAIEGNKDYKVLKILGKMECKLEKDMKKVELAEI